jgi:hypothetical protein
VRVSPFRKGSSRQLQASCRVGVVKALPEEISMETTPGAAGDNLEATNVQVPRTAA